jgi:hypothetical protein
MFKSNPRFSMLNSPKQDTIGVTRRTNVKQPHDRCPLLTYIVENKMSFIRHIVEQQGCNCIVEDDKNLNGRTQKHPMLKPKPKFM